MILKNRFLVSNKFFFRLCNVVCSVVSRADVVCYYKWLFPVSQCESLIGNMRRAPRVSGIGTRDLQFKPRTSEFSPRQEAMCKSGRVTKWNLDTQHSCIPPTRFLLNFGILMRLRMNPSRFNEILYVTKF